MSRYPEPRQFDPRQPLEVRVRFRWAGRDYAPGEPFNWRQTGVDMRRVRQMFEAGKLQAAASASAPEPIPQPEPTPQGFDSFDKLLRDAEIEVVPGKNPDFDSSDGLDEIYSLKDLREIAEMEGAPIKRSIKEQRDAIRESRNG